ncbi:ATP phosphoribosyltransferase [Caulobacter mirabilis]|uniref:ATP phosphoribosyltransferase n=1 Tax=Caulobacter mirabilis TaxID=69666 RepID=A0A2D2ATC5_9CAUL|nr:ATP phosphoribosyltransferase [Caulobacter mirabilis]ATQ41260.1 ATP phosphoribosyltransferase [Caulobacter mirabilis]
MSGPLVLAIPSKGRLKEQVEAWLADAGLPVSAPSGSRGYTAKIDALPQIEVRLLSASDIAAALESGEIHLGVTGEDLLRERIADLDSRVMLLRALGFGRADLVVAVPKSWLDVDGMADLEEVAHLHLTRTGRRLRVATKYIVQTRAFFARAGVADYRIVESGGATEGAPASGAAEIIVDITTTGATLAANHLKILGDGVILKSQARLAASLAADWDAERLMVVRRLMGLVEARGRAKGSVMLVWPAERDEAAKTALADLVARGARPRANGLLIAEGELLAAQAALAEADIGPVAASRPEHLFEPVSEAAEALASRVTA